MSTLLVTGGDGQLGRALRQVLPDGRFAGSRDLDISDLAAIQSYDWSGVEAVVNAAAWTAVDAAEEAESFARAWSVNADGVSHLAEHARRLGIPLVHVSTDYVFSGDHSAPIPVDAAIDPRTAYGLSKAAGELAARRAPVHYVVRTGWLFGDGPNFVRTMLRLAATRTEVTVVDDQFGRPTYAADLAQALARILQVRPPAGTYHATGSGDVVSWAGFAAAVLDGTQCTVRPVTTAEYAAGASAPTAPRPAYSALDLGTLEAAGIGMRDWRVALHDYLALERSEQNR